ncbi:MAG: 1-deoxy-D-xylulose-5-phosphate reductoisomerase [Alphaproteobacteria bacterium]|nr:1-deoxy-D-xylulose-5-phosphate reductoisomerase [Alphaproteobacteria bacterium]
MAVTSQGGGADKRRISILGSTGSVGCNTLDLLRWSPPNFSLEALTAGNNVEKLVAQALEFKPRMVVIGEEGHYAALKEALAGTNIAIGAGPDALVEAADIPADWVMAAIVGAAGLAPTLAAIRRGATVALANKECLVCAGPLLLAEIEKSGATLLPVDSEHSAIFQVFDFENADAVERLILTASGGPFLRMDLAAMAEVTPEQAVAHPIWDMGAKISVDSATMMNKGLEIIEASYLFPVPEDRIEVLIHPQSVVHSAVAYSDGSVLAQLGVPDMRTPIAYALAWPRRQSSPAGRLDLAAVGSLTFESPDIKRFPALSLAREALKTGDSAPTVLNAANEVAVQGFLTREIGYLDIMRVVRQVLDKAPKGRIASIEDVTLVDGEARRYALEEMASIRA